MEYPPKKKKTHVWSSFHSHAQQPMLKEESGYLLEVAPEDGDAVEGLFDVNAYQHHYAKHFLGSCATRPSPPPLCCLTDQKADEKKEWLTKKKKKHHNHAQHVVKLMSTM